MTRNEGFWVEPSAAAACSQLDLARASSRPAPDEGIQLMRAFLGIGQPAVRQAVIELVTKLSSPDGQAG
jgi:hypothetical protein